MGSMGSSRIGFSSGVASPKCSEIACYNRGFKEVGRSNLAEVTDREISWRIRVQKEGCLRDDLV